MTGQQMAHSCVRFRRSDDEGQRRGRDEHLQNESAVLCGKPECPGEVRSQWLSSLGQQSNPNTSDSQSTPRNPAPSSSGRDFKQQSGQREHQPWILDQPAPLSECSPREDRRVFPPDEGPKQGNISSCGYSHLWDIVQLSRKKMVLEIKYTCVEIIPSKEVSLNEPQFLQP